MSVEDIWEEVKRDIVFYGKGRGGITASGGEPLLHAEFIRTLFEYCHAHNITTAVSYTHLLKEIDLYEMMEAVKQISEYKLEINDYFDIMMIWYRDVLLYKATADVNHLVFRDEIYDIKKSASKSSYEGIEQILEALEKAKVRLNANVNFDLVIELLLLTIKEN